MRNTWESLTEDQKQCIRSNARILTEAEIAEQFSIKDNNVTFRILRKTDSALAGGLDFEHPPSNEISGGECADNPEENTEIEIVEVSLISPEDFDYEPEVTDADIEAAKPIDEAVSGLESYYEQDTISAEEAECIDDETMELPPIVDHRPKQSVIKHQGRRGTCVSHASMGLLEAHDQIPDDLSEQCAHYKFNEFLNRSHSTNKGLRTTDAAKFLSKSDGQVCEESDWPYISDQSTINRMVNNGTYRLPRNAEDNAIYGIKSYKIITDRGLSGESIKNTRYLESLLHKGYDIVIGTWVSWDDKDNNGILDPRLNQSGRPIGFGGHAMLVVGYNRQEQYFIVKNSWGRGWGHGGYAYFHYNLVRSCFKYGFVVNEVVPETPSSSPRNLTQAPYETEKIDRARLQAAILFMKTSRGRYAVCEAYAGDNLLLRNLRVYNADGSMHLERDSLIVRGAYLCDIDSARETSKDADFWWQAVRPGENYLVPRNGAALCVAFDLAKLDAKQINSTTLNSSPIASSNLNYAVIVGRTTANRPFKMLAHARPDNKLHISYLELFDTVGRRYRCASKLDIPMAWTYNLDTLRVGGQYADIWWHVVSDDAGLLEKYSRAEIQLLWNL